VAQIERDPLPPRVPSSVLLQQLPLGNDWRRRFAFADARSAACDAQESQHRGHRYSELVHRIPLRHDGLSLNPEVTSPSARKTQLSKIHRRRAGFLVLQFRSLYVLMGQ